ncbi:MAG TPA: hypothetical protein VFK02_12795 [Kofleriaceae bacterium]|nr:hypothetical protein [Kofleriaceae bacterium]
MNASHLIPVALAGVLAAGRPAHADPEAYNPNAFDLSGALDRDVAPTPRSLEIAIGGGYTQGIGGAGLAGSVEDLTGPGGNLEVQVGLRTSPRFGIGLYGTVARYRHGDVYVDGSRTHGATAGIQAVWHARPARSLGPWIGLGAGWRALWLSPAGAPQISVHGIELLRVQLGIDYRLTPAIAVTPVIGASASVFVVEDAAMPSEFAAVRDNRLNVYGYTGVLGRFDLGG